jgi:hypothetical protein
MKDHSFFQPVGPNRRGPILVSRSDLTGYRKLNRTNLNCKSKHVVQMVWNGLSSGLTGKSDRFER